jgi:hypothetical protein
MLCGDLGGFGWIGVLAGGDLREACSAEQVQAYVASFDPFDRRDEAAVGVGDHETDAGQAAGREAAQECQSAGPVLVAADLEAEDFAAAVGVDPDRDQRVDVHGAALFTDFDDQRVDPDEVETPADTRWPRPR